VTALVWVGGLITLALLGYLLFALLAPERLS
jgi:K+-transporting ATPase KdpF subunit